MMAHSKQPGSSNKQSKFPILQDAEEFSQRKCRLSAFTHGVGGEKQQLPAGNAEPLQAPKASTAMDSNPEHSQQGENALSIHQWAWRDLQK